MKCTECLTNEALNDDLQCQQCLDNSKNDVINHYNILKQKSDLKQLNSKNQVWRGICNSKKIPTIQKESLKKTELAILLKMDKSLDLGLSVLLLSSDFKLKTEIGITVLYNRFLKETVSTFNYVNGRDYLYVENFEKNCYALSESQGLLFIDNIEYIKDKDLINTILDNSFVNKKPLILGTSFTEACPYLSKFGAKQLINLDVM